MGKMKDLYMDLIYDIMDTTGKSYEEAEIELDARIEADAVSYTHLRAHETG
jgi:hypothetical protein